MEATEYIKTHDHLIWLQMIAKEYRTFIDRIRQEGEYFVVQGIGYTARGDGKVFYLNSHRPIKTSFILEGMLDALRSVEEEIKEIKTSLKSVQVELEDD